VEGAKITVALAVLSQVTGIFLGVLAALGRMSPIGPVRWFVGFYLWIFRGTPLLVQLFFVYFAVPQFTNENLILGEFLSAFVAFSLNEGAYMAEIVRAGITSVDFGQMEAASSLGMTRGLAMRRIILPQAVRIIIPPTGNEFVSMLKNTSLASTIAVTEIFYQTNQIRSATFHAFEPLAVVSLWYLAMTTVANYLQTFLEDYFGRGFTREVRQAGIMRRTLSAAMRRG
jgi:polar amino acid transport system permease protein